MIEELQRIFEIDAFDALSIIKKTGMAIELGRSPRILWVPINRHWWMEIYGGRKPIEYRNQSQHWDSRLQGREYDLVAIRNGYGRHVPLLVCACDLIDLGTCPYPDWSAQYWRIHLGPVGLVRNAPKVATATPANNGAAR